MQLGNYMIITIEKMQSVLCLVTGSIFLLLVCVYIASPANLLIVLAILTTKVTLYQIPCEPCIHHVYATCPVFFLCQLFTLQWMLYCKLRLSHEHPSFKQQHCCWLSITQRFHGWFCDRKAFFSVSLVRAVHPRDVTRVHYFISPFTCYCQVVMIKVTSDPML